MIMSKNLAIGLGIYILLMLITAFYNWGRFTRQAYLFRKYLKKNRKDLYHDLILNVKIKDAFRWKLIFDKNNYGDKNIEKYKTLIKCYVKYFIVSVLIGLLGLLLFVGYLFLVSRNYL